MACLVAKSMHVVFIINGMANGEPRESGGEGIGVCPKHFVPWVLTPLKDKSKVLHWKSPACIKERLSTSAHTSQSPTERRKRETTETNEDPAGCQPCDPVCA